MGRTPLHHIGHLLVIKEMHSAILPNMATTPKQDVDTDVEKDATTTKEIDTDKNKVACPTSSQAHVSNKPT